MKEQISNTNEIVYYKVFEVAKYENQNWIKTQKSLKCRIFNMAKKKVKTKY